MEWYGAFGFNHRTPQSGSRHTEDAGGSGQPSTFVGTMFGFEEFDDEQHQKYQWQLPKFWWFAQLGSREYQKHGDDDVEIFG